MVDIEPNEPATEAPPSDDRREGDEVPAKKLKQAVLLVHGMGEQMPMETLRGFVQTMWVEDRSLGRTSPNKVWFRSDERNDSNELWRITTGPIKKGAGTSRQRVDFYEFYWADLTAATTLDQLKDWFSFLLMRRWGQVPERVRSAWLILWGATVVTAFFAGWQALAAAKFLHALPTWASAVIAMGAFAYAAVIGVVVAYLGDVARYCRAKPPNIAARRQIRERGLKRMKALTSCGDYDRVILVGHSLGSIVAYDMLKLLWADWAERHELPMNGPLFNALIACKAAGDALKTAQPDQLSAKRDAYRAAQAAVFDATSTDPGGETPWLVSDFVTMGAALSHSEFLLAHDAKEFDGGKMERRFPSIPPIADGKHGYIYQEGKNGALKVDLAAGFSAGAGPTSMTTPSTSSAATSSPDPARRSSGRGCETSPWRSAARPVSASCFPASSPTRSTGPTRARIRATDRLQSRSSCCARR